MKYLYSFTLCILLLLPVGTVFAQTEGDVVSDPVSEEETVLEENVEEDATETEAAPDEKPRFNFMVIDAPAAQEDTAVAEEAATDSETQASNTVSTSGSPLVIFGWIVLIAVVLGGILVYMKKIKLSGK